MYLLSHGDFSGYYCTSGVDRPDPGAGMDVINCSCPDQTVFTGELNENYYLMSLSTLNLVQTI